MNWLHNEIISGMQMMCAARLRGSPEQEEFESVEAVWMAVLQSQNVAWDEEKDAWRIRKAFLAHIGVSSFFATPNEILAAMPKRKGVAVLALPNPENYSMPEAIRSEVKRVGRLSREQSIVAAKEIVGALSDSDKSKVSRIALDALGFL